MKVEFKGKERTDNGYPKLMRGRHSPSLLVVAIHDGNSNNTFTGLTLEDNMHYSREFDSSCFEEVVGSVTLTFE